MSGLLHPLQLQHSEDVLKGCADRKSTSSIKKLITITNKLLQLLLQWAEEPVS